MLETKRLILRRWNESDAESLYEYAILISVKETLPLSTCLFETASAVGTVGLTLGITTSLSVSSQLILIFLMYLGRVGGLTLIYAVASSVHEEARLPQEKITVG